MHISSKLLLTFTNNMFDIYHFKPNEKDMELLTYKGIVYKKNTTDILIPPFYFKEEYIYNTDKYNNWLSTVDISSSTFFYAMEGSVVRVFYYHDSWHVLTHKKNAFESKWSCPFTFGELFINGIEDEYYYNNKFKSYVDTNNIQYIEDDPFNLFLNILDKEKVHYFIVRNIKENRVYCEPPVLLSKIVSIGSVPLYSKKLVLSNPIVTMCHNEPIKCNDTITLNHIFTNLSIHDYFGIIVLDSSGNYIKITHDTYQVYKNIRGSHSNIIKRYYEIRHNKHLVNLFLKMYPELFLKVEKIERSVLRICDKIFSLYKNKYIFNKPVHIPFQYISILNDIHLIYKTKKKKINMHQVILCWNKLKPYIQEKNIKMNSN